MIQKTLDILDKQLSSKEKYYLKLGDEVRYSLYKETFLLDRVYWDRHFSHINKYAYNWQEFKYTDINKPDSLDQLITTKDIGVYLFIIKSENQFLDMPKYVFYVGISGEGGSSRPLVDRLKDYFRIEGIKKRKKVHRMLEKYHSSVYIKFSTMNIPSTALEKLEVDLHGFFYPIANERDFPPELKQQRQADLR